MNGLPATCSVEEAIEAYTTHSATFLPHAFGWLPMVQSPSCTTLPCSSVPPCPHAPGKQGGDPGQSSWVWGSKG